MKEKKMVSILLSCVLLIGIGQLGLCAMSGCVQDYGVLYPLQDVYNAQEIDRDDLLNIAYYNGDIERNQEALQGFTPEPIGELSENTAQKIRECVAQSYRNDGANTGYADELNTTAEDIRIVKYLGCYNGYYAVRYRNTRYIDTTEEKDPDDYVQEVGGIEFVYVETSRIYLWK